MGTVDRTEWFKTLTKLVTTTLSIIRVEIRRVLHPFRKESSSRCSNLEKFSPLIFSLCIFNLYPRTHLYLITGLPNRRLVTVELM